MSKIIAKITINWFAAVLLASILASHAIDLFMDYRGI